jgi:hypothetical protein
MKFAIVNSRFRHAGQPGTTTPGPPFAMLGVSVRNGRICAQPEAAPLSLTAAMWDFEYVIELAKAYRRAEITRAELQAKIHSRSLNAAMFGVNTFSVEYGYEATADFVVAAGLPIFYQRVKPGPPAADFTIIEDDDESPLAIGTWI